MATNSTIEWTDTTWNPLNGCTKISPGCKHCYAERMPRRLKAMGQPNYRNGFRLTLHERMLGEPLTCRRPRRVFVNSMSDLFHKDVPAAFIHRVFGVMRAALPTPPGGPQVATDSVVSSYIRALWPIQGEWPRGSGSPAR